MKNIIKNRHADDIMLVINVTGTSSGLDQNKVHVKVTISQ